MKNSRSLIKFLIGAISIVITGCEEEGKKVADLSKTDGRDTLAAFIVHDTIVNKTIELPAELLPFEKAEIFARVEGYVKEIKVDIGDRIRRGQTLAIIEAPELNTKYAEFQASLHAAKAKYANSAYEYQRLYKASTANTPGIVAPVDLERSRNQYLSDSATFEASRQLAKSYQQVAGYLVLQAPFDGVVTARNADRGTLVGSNQSLLTVQQNNTLRLRMAVPELYVASAAVDKEVLFRVDAYPEKIFKATFSRKSESIDAGTRTELWEYLYDNEQHELKAGTFGYAKLNIARKNNSYIVPPTAITTNQERKFIIKIKNEKAEWIDVRQGISTEKGIEIFGEIDNGDTLLFRANDEIKPGFSAFWKIANH